MRFESRRAFSAALPIAPPRVEVEHLPPEIGFLQSYQVEAAALRGAAVSARDADACAARTLIVEGGATAALYYRALADHLHLPFVEKWPRIVQPADPAAAYRAEALRLADHDPPHWVVAPTERNLRMLVEARRLRLPLDGLSITTPSHLSSILLNRAGEAVEQAARNRLHEQAPHLSAKGAADGRAAWACLLSLVLCMICWVLAPRLLADLVGLIFLAGILFRAVLMLVGSSTMAKRSEPLTDAELPFYTVLVPLSREAGIVPTLVEHLRAIDYPESKLEILVLVEPEDRATREALAASRLPRHFRVVVGPSDRTLRTKPRALNIGLMMARGTLLTVYDAEDRPDPDQLRRAASLFAGNDDRLACVQARLAIGNGGDSLLARLFAIEYAVLFDLQNLGTTALGLPLALGGTSNHFRVATLREVGGWDAWNVTEDADLGLRLARLGYEVAALHSTTTETAPRRLSVWMKQRRRWTKGWMQTFLVLARDARNVRRSLGWMHAAAVLLMLVNLVIGPLALPLFCGLVIYNLAIAGLPHAHSVIGLLESGLDLLVLASGIGVTLWSGYAGLRARGLRRFLPSLPLILPYQLMISLAAWMGLWDLVMNPYQWHKTPHEP